MIAISDRRVDLDLLVGLKSHWQGGGQIVTRRIASGKIIVGDRADGRSIGDQDSTYVG
ncbi:hypothetical protein [Roseimaritima ulvae]|uniref:hypothetical protein n=1 Tax=Roseimaritima ulvae TaxID=980254 RepID=UPI001EE3B307|nr:hypothetical protein [Roseimaritima ulvae]